MNATDRLQALIYSNDAIIEHNEHLKAIKLSTYGVVFFGTPHQAGTYVSLAELWVNVVSVYQHTNTTLLQHLERDSEWLEQDLERFNPVGADIFTVFCYESYPTKLKAGPSLVVSFLDSFRLEDADVNLDRP